MPVLEGVPVRGWLRRGRASTRLGGGVVQERACQYEAGW